MKKIIALLMVCGFALTFVACGGGAKETSVDTDTTATTTEPAAVEADTTSTDTTSADTTAAAH